MYSPFPNKFAPRESGQDFDYPHQSPNELLLEIIKKISRHHLSLEFDQHLFLAIFRIRQCRRLSQGLYCLPPSAIPPQVESHESCRPNWYQSLWIYPSWDEATNFCSASSKSQSCPSSSFGLERIFKDLPQTMVADSSLPNPSEMPTTFGNDQPQLRAVLIIGLSFSGHNERRIQPSSADLQSRGRNYNPFLKPAPWHWS